MKFVLGRVENIGGKGENNGCQHFLLFPQYFRKASSKKSGLCGKLLICHVVKNLDIDKMLVHVTYIFSFSTKVFFPIKDRYHQVGYRYIAVCKCFLFGQVLNFVIYQTVKSLYSPACFAVMKILIPEMRTGVRFLTCSSDLINISLCT